MAENILMLGEENFDQEVIKSNVPVLVDFWAEWCAPCKAMLPALEEIAGQSDGRYKIAKVNVSDYPQLAADYNITSIPAMIFFKSGREQDRLVGMNPKAKVAQRLKALL